MKKFLACVSICLFLYSSLLWPMRASQETEIKQDSFSLGTLSVTTIVAKLKQYAQALQCGLIDRHDASAHILVDFIANNIHLLILMHPDFFQILKDEELHTICNVLSKKLVRQGVSFDLSHQSQQLHDLSIRALAELDDNHFISSSEDKTIRIWDIKTAKSVKTLIGHTGIITALTTCMTDNIIPGRSSYIVSGSTDKKIRIWEACTGLCYSKVLEGHTGTIYSIAHLTDRYIASASADKTIRIWDMLTGSCINEIACHRGAVYSVIRVTNSIVASASADKTVRIVDVPSGKCLKTFEGHQDDVFCLIALDDRYIASASADKTIRIWDRLAGMCVKVLEGHTNSVYTLVRINDELLASGSADKTIRIWNRHSGECLKVLPGSLGSIKSLLSLSSLTLLSGCEDGTISVWNINEQTCLEDFFKKAQAVIAFAPQLKNVFEDLIKTGAVPFKNTVYTDLICLLEIQLREKAKSKNEVIRILIGKVQELLNEYGQQGVNHLSSLLKAAHTLQLELVADALRYVLCISVQNVSLDEYKQFSVNLKGLSCYAIISSDNRVFLVARNVAELSPYLKGMFDSQMKEGQEKDVTLYGMNGLAVNTVIFLLNKFYFHKLGPTPFVSNHILRFYLGTFQQIVPQAIVVAEEWALPQIAQLLTNYIVHNLDDSQIPQLIENLPVSCHKYIAPELAPSCDLLLWQLKSCGQAIKLHYLLGKNIAFAYTKFIMEHFSQILKRFPNFEEVIEQDEYLFIHLPLKEALLRKIYSLTGGDKPIDIDKLKDVSIKELFDVVKELSNIMNTQLHQKVGNTINF